MKKTTKPNSAFKLNSFTIIEFHIERNPVKQGKSDIIIKPSGQLDKTAQTFNLILDVAVKDENESFKISLTAVGIFSFNSQIEEQELSNYFLTNAPAIIFPYIRAYISSVTALSGLKTVNLPVMNMSYLKDELKENIKNIIDQIR